YPVYGRTDTPTTHSPTLSLHDALPICAVHERQVRRPLETAVGAPIERRETRVLGRKEERIGHSERLEDAFLRERIERAAGRDLEDRKSTRLNSSHVKISYAVFCLKKKK